jgi:magnesium chelatase family protein
MEINAKAAKATVMPFVTVTFSLFFQRDRFKPDRIFCNSKMNTKSIRKYCLLNRESKELLKLAMTELGLSAPAYDKILKVSRTIADLASSEYIKTEHPSEAIQYRGLDREFFV